MFRNDLHCCLKTIQGVVLVILIIYIVVLHNTTLKYSMLHKKANPLDSCLYEQSQGIKCSGMNCFNEEHF